MEVFIIFFDLAVIYIRDFIDDDDSESGIGHVVINEPDLRKLNINPNFRSIDINIIIIIIISSNIRLWIDT